MKKKKDKKVVQPDNKDVENNVNEAEEKDGEEGTVPYLALGLIFGCVLGVVLDNITLYVSIGLLIGIFMNGSKNNRA